MSYVNDLKIALDEIDMHAEMLGGDEFIQIPPVLTYSTSVFSAAEIIKDTDGKAAGAKQWHSKALWSTFNFCIENYSLIVSKDGAHYPVFSFRAIEKYGSDDFESILKNLYSGCEIERFTFGKNAMLFLGRIFPKLAAFHVNTDVHGVDADPSSDKTYTLNLNFLEIGGRKYVSACGPRGYKPMKNEAGRIAGFLDRQLAPVTSRSDSI